MKYSLIQIEYSLRKRICYRPFPQRREQQDFPVPPEAALQSLIGVTAPLLAQFLLVHHFLLDSAQVPLAPHSLLLPPHLPPGLTANTLFPSFPPGHRQNRPVCFLHPSYLPVSLLRPQTPGGPWVVSCQFLAPCHVTEEALNPFSFFA